MERVKLISIFVAGAVAVLCAMLLSVITYLVLGPAIAQPALLLLIAVMGFLVIFFIEIILVQRRDQRIAEANKKVEETAIRNKALEESSVMVEAQVKERTMQLREEESRLIASINSLSLGYIMLDTDGKVFINNAVIESFFPHVQGESVFETAARELNGSVDLKKNLDEVIKDRKIVDVSHIKYSSYYFRVYMAPVMLMHDQEGLIGVVLLIDNTTEQELLNQFRNNFIAIASHEMRTPLTIIEGDAELILQGIERKPENEENVKFLTSIMNNSLQLLNVLHDFIDVAQQEDHQVKLNVISFDLRKLVGDVVNDMQPIAKAKEIYLKFNEPQSDIPLISADIDKSRQILVNLIGNAVHYTDKGGITIDMAVADDDGKKYTKVSVTDTGVGVSKESQAMLFQKFGTVGNNYIHRTEYGSGLGLYICRMLSTAMGGSVTLERSEPNMGSTFVFLLPIGS